MTPLVVVIAVVLVVVVVVNLVGRARAGRRSVRSHHRALDTLGHISHQYQDDENPRHTMAPPPPSRTGRQAHVRVVSADAEALPSPKPMAGGWRPTRATGAAPFRRPPSQRHDLWEDAAEAAPASDAPSGVPVVAPSAVDQVRVVARVDPVDLRPRSTGRDPAAPGIAGSSGRPDDEVALSPLPVPPPAAPDRPGAPMAFDDVASASGAPTGPIPVHRPLGVPVGRTASTPPRAARTDLTALAAVPRIGSRSHQRRPARHRSGPGRRLGAGLVVLLVVVVVAVGADLALDRHTHHTKVTAAPVVHHHRPEKAAVAPVVTTTPTTIPTAFRLVSTSPGASVYHLTGTRKVTLRAVGPCWVEIRHGNDLGALVYSETMPAGGVETVTGPVWVRLGNPTAVSVTIGGRVVSAPVTSGEPYDLEFE